ncbi:MAG: rubrerythrin family protein [Anaerolineae bacterium]|nr:rubrerythrin family protein [Anaerolineae bacterium]NPV09898.1 rubrerythrin family protein [Anaerolineae bacterium]
MAVPIQLDVAAKRAALAAQANELTEYHVYTRLADSTQDEDNARVLRAIGEDELRHYRFWARLTGEEPKPDRWRIWWYLFISRLFGLTFGMRLLERAEEYAHEVAYRRLIGVVPGIEAVAQDEEKHEQQLIELIDEERLRYVGSVVLGLNDALVELTGTLAGLTFALRNTDLIAVSGLITGIAASLSMAASGYLSAREEEGEQDPLKSSLYTGAAYVLAVAFLVLPFLLLGNPYAALAWTGINAVGLIAVFNYYVSVARDISFKDRFLEMAAISLGVAVVSFGLGYLVRVFLGVDV